MADIFLKSKFKKGNYLLALEIFWECEDYTNINISFHSEDNAYIPYKLISSGSNFDIVFYKAFMSYYIDIINPNPAIGTPLKQFNAKKMAI